MTDAVARYTPERRSSRPLAPGYGLLIGAGVSLGLWGGLLWLALAIF